MQHAHARTRAHTHTHMHTRVHTYTYMCVYELYVVENKRQSISQIRLEV